LAPAVSEYVDPEGRRFEYVHIRRGRPDLVVHFSAFFGKWGEAKPYRDRFQGYFHRLKMLGSAEEHDWLFLCDPYGAFDNGTYYTGQKGDFFVERATSTIIGKVIHEGNYANSRVATIGSSMGATAALKFGLRFDVKGIVAIGPHIDLDISAIAQGREQEVAWICPDGDFAAPHNFVYTRQITNLVNAWDTTRPLPALFLQSCADDVGVHDQQVVPLYEQWGAKGGTAYLDTRPTGGHTSDYATRPLMLDALSHLLAGEPIDVARYRRDPAFAGQLTVPPLSHRLRRRASLLRNRLLRRG
jgi:hypothetical protein